MFDQVRNRDKMGRITPPRIFPSTQTNKYNTALPVKPKKKKYKVFATEWSNPQNAKTIIGNITPTVVESPLRGA